eukprot:1170696-Lingulodinium_polyedra.AAC.1
MALSCQLTQLDVTSIENALEASAPPGVLGPVAESERGWLGREYVLIINDCMHSGSNLKSHTLRNQTDIREMCDQYDELFRLVSQMFQNIIYVKSPPAEYWKVSGADNFERILEQA